MYMSIANSLVLVLSNGQYNLQLKTKSKLLGLRLFIMSISYVCLESNLYRFPLYTTILRLVKILVWCLYLLVILEQSVTLDYFNRPRMH